MAKFKCKKGCGIFRSKCNLKDHMNTVHNPKRVQFQCDLCPKSFYRKTSLTNHVVTIHYCLRPFVCRFCSKSFTQGTHLRIHINSFHHGIWHWCKKCGVKFPSVTSLNKHIRQVHLKQKLNPAPRKTNRVKFRCELCGHQFTYKSALKTHLIRHNAIKFFKCYLCSKKFHTKIEKLKHEQIHSSSRTPTKMKKCKFCEKFISESHLHEHNKRFHYNIEKIACMFCEKTSKTKLDLLDHLLRHIQEKWYACELCGKEFCAAFEKSRHMRSHTGERPYKCKKCSLSFSSKHSLNQHSSQHNTQTDI